MSEEINADRRTFLRQSLLTAAAAALPPAAAEAAVAPARARRPGPLCLFSKPLPHMGYAELARSVRQAGFEGIDLTVRPGGHVVPERVTVDLPRAAEAIRSEGLAMPFITTDLHEASDPGADATLATAGKLGIHLFKPGYYQYRYRNVQAELQEAGRKFRSLAALGARHGVAIGYHNHEGMIGAPVWDMASVILPMDPRWSGFYFDVRHATVEGGSAGWRVAAHLVQPRLKMIGMKDFYWEKTSRGWKIIDCPLGQGMVHWPEYFRILAQAGYSGPVSLFLEYDIPGRTIAEQQDNTLAAAKRDLGFLRHGLDTAYAAAYAER
jgi:sugar phosphate isomerase/epimerase